MEAVVPKEEEPTHRICIDLERLNDTVYMETITGTPSWGKLEAFLRDSFIIDFLNRLRSAGLPESTRHQVIEAFLRGLSEEDRASLRTTLEVSDLLDTLIDAKVPN